MRTPHERYQDALSILVNYSVEFATLCDGIELSNDLGATQIIFYGQQSRSMEHFAARLGLRADSVRDVSTQREVRRYYSGHIGQVFIVARMRTDKITRVSGKPLP